MGLHLVHNHFLSRVQDLLGRDLGGIPQGHNPTRTMFVWSRVWKPCCTEICVHGYSYFQDMCPYRVVRLTLSRSEVALVVCLESASAAVVIVASLSATRSVVDAILGILVGQLMSFVSILDVTLGTSRICILAVGGALRSLKQ